MDNYSSKNGHNNMGNDSIKNIKTTTSITSTTTWTAITSKVPQQQQHNLWHEGRVTNSKYVCGNSPSLVTPNQDVAFYLYLGGKPTNGENSSASTYI